MIDTVRGLTAYLVAAIVVVLDMVALIWMTASTHRAELDKSGTAYAQRFRAYRSALVKAG